MVLLAALAAVFLVVLLALVHQAFEALVLTCHAIYPPFPLPSRVPARRPTVVRLRPAMSNFPRRRRVPLLFDMN